MRTLLVAATSVLAVSTACHVSGTPAYLVDEPAEGVAADDALQKSAVVDPCLEPPSDDRRVEVCRRWECERRGAVAATWTGDPLSCAAGEVDVGARDRALALVNVYRFLAGVPPVTAELGWQDAAQQCALLAHANAALAHYPPKDWRCWSDLGARASAASLIANRSAPIAIGAFIEDPGNETTMVHRRWLLAEELRSVALGSTNRYACVVVDGRAVAPAKEDDDSAASKLAAPRGWVSWPPPGPVPIGALELDRIDETGWTVQSSTYALEGARVEVTVNGERAPIATTPLERAQGSLSALRILPMGWRTEAGSVYRVRVTGGEVDVDLSVEPIACP